MPVTGTVNKIIIRQKTKAIRDLYTGSLKMTPIKKIVLLACVAVPVLYFGMRYHTLLAERAPVCDPIVQFVKYVKSDLIEPVHPSDASEKLPTHKMSKSVLQSDWWQAVSYLEYDLEKRPIDYKCKNITKEGNWPVCQDGNYKIKSPCLVYSFGIAYDFSFDDAMASHGCEVHSFDPSMFKSDHKRGKSVYFHAIGLGAKNLEHFEARRDVYVWSKQMWTVMTLGTIMAALGHKKRHLDVLKVDIEVYEWEVLEYLLDSDLLPKIKQFSLEYHMFKKNPPKSDYPKLLKLYKKLHDRGFEKFYTNIHRDTRNPHPDSFNLQVDIGYVNTAFR